ncbi:flagellar basal body rod C-terminal domain-containing protein [Candidatus Riflebacteria bacterium]
MSIQKAGASLASNIKAFEMAQNKPNLIDSATKGIEAKRAIQASAKVLKTENENLGTIIDLLA